MFHILLYLFYRMMLILRYETDLLLRVLHALPNLQKCPWLPLNEIGS